VVPATGSKSTQREIRPRRSPPARSGPRESRTPLSGVAPTELDATGFHGFQQLGNRGQSDLLHPSVCGRGLTVWRYFVPVLPPPQMTETGVAIAVGGIGLVGVVVGAGIGLFGTLLTASRQIDRQERNARRAAYASYVEAALRATDLLVDQRRAFVAANEGAEAYYMFLDEIRDPANATSVEYIRLQAGKAWSSSDTARAQLESLLDEFRPVWRDLTIRGHELKIHAPAVVHEAAMLIYSSVGAATAYDRPADPGLGSAQSRALLAFSAVARADSRSPDAPRTWLAERRLRTEMEELTSEFRRIERAMHQETTPEMLRPLLTEDELEMP
jgi:hypothetical protein